VEAASPRTAPARYSKKVPKKVRALAFGKALSERILAGDVLLVGASTSRKPRAKQFLALVGEVEGLARKTLIIGAAVKRPIWLRAMSEMRFSPARAR
jgi:ribosomal protein L4